jgi:nitrogen fixation NifU-like protein
VNERLQQLYKEVILKHSKEPFHFAKRPEASIQIEAYNPLCGDQYQLYLEIQDQRISEIFFHGYGCAISKAATSLLARELVNKRLPEVEAEIERYLAIINPEIALPEDLSEEYAAFAAARQFPARQQCAALSWESLRDYLDA